MIIVKDILNFDICLFCFKKLAKLTTMSLNITLLQTISTIEPILTNFTSTIEPTRQILGYDITGIELMLFYIALNILILFVILILACRSGAIKTREEKLRRKQRQKERDNNIQLTVIDDTTTRTIEDIHGNVSSLGKIGSIKTCCGACFEDIMNRSFIYSAFLVHVWDQGSDLGVIYTWFTEDNGKWKYLAWISIGILINYRLFSAYSLRKAQRGWRDTLLQILDLQLFVDVFRSFEDVKPTDSLYWIRAMEAVLESCLQVLLQFVYLYQQTDILVWLSLFGSLASVIFSLLHYTDVVFVFEEAKESFCTQFKWYIAYASRFLFRLFEVTSRCMVLALIWSTWNSIDHDDLTGAYIVGCIIGLELIFYALLTQIRVPPWEIAAFLIVNIDLTLTFEGRAGALTKPLKKNIFYRCICKPVSEMFTKISSETELYFEEHHDHKRNRTQVNNKFGVKNEPNKQKLLIAPAHYIYRFLESIFEIFCVLTYGVLNEEIYNRLFSDNRWWQLSIATTTTILTPIFYCIVRSFADESKTLERNLIAMVFNKEVDTKEIMKLIGSGASLIERDYEGNNIVHACIMTNNGKLLRRIIRRYQRNKKSINLHAINKAGYSPLLLTAKHGSIDCLKILTQLNQDLNKNEIDFDEIHIYSGQSLIHVAAQFDQNEIIQYLLNNKNCMIDIHKTYTFINKSTNIEISGYNACHVSARFNSINSFQLLLNAGIDYQARLSNNDTCAIIAASRGHLIILDQLFQIGDNLNIRGNFGHTPLYRAALNSHPGTVLVLGRDFGANPRIPDDENINIVQRCFSMCKWQVLTSLATLGLRFDCVSDLKLLEIEDENKLTALMWSAKYNNPKLVKTLLESGVLPNHTNKLNETAAHHAAAMGNLDCLKILKRYNANFALANNANQTPKDKAIQMNKKQVIKWFNNL